MKKLIASTLTPILAVAMVAGVSFLREATAAPGGMNGTPKRQQAISGPADSKRVAVLDQITATAGKVQSLTVSNLTVTGNAVQLQNQTNVVVLTNATQITLTNMPTYRAGFINIPTGVTQTNISFTLPWTNANYVVVLQNNDPYNDNSQWLRTTLHKTNGFTLNLNKNAGGGCSVDWLAIPWN